MAYRWVVLRVVAVWSWLIITLLVLQFNGLPFGFVVQPQGAFKNWLKFLEGSGSGVANLFWIVEHRNPLAPWWYIAARPLIAAVPSAPLILHLLAGLFVGVSGGLLMTKLTRSAIFGVSVGMLSAVFICSVHLDNVIWSQLVALGFTLTTIWLFAMFCDDTRNTFLLGMSYVTWFIAFTTYTIQVGAILAVFFLAYRSRCSLASKRIALAGAIRDSAPYACLLGLYVLIWITTSPALPTVTQFSFNPGAVLKSAAFGIWNEHYWFFWIWLKETGHPFLMAAIFVATALATFLLLNAEKLLKSPMPELGLAATVAMCVVAPTLMLESVSPIFVPGTRWPMLLQFWAPFAFCIVLFAGLGCVPEMVGLLGWRFAMAGATGFVILLVLGFNNMQVRRLQMEGSITPAHNALERGVNSNRWAAQVGP